MIASYGIMLHTLYSCILMRSTTTTKLLQSYAYFLFVGHIGKVV